MKKSKNLFNSAKFIIDGNPIAENNKIKVENFIEVLLELEKKGNTKIIFRGESVSNLQKKFELENNVKLNDFLFLIGEKGKFFRKKYRNKIIKKYKLFSIDDVSTRFFKYLFDKYNKVCKSKRTIIKSFFEENITLFNFFSNKNNKSKFIKTIEFINPNEKVIVRDYYLVPLHHLGKAGYYNNSFLLSCTKNFKVARTFSNNGLVIIGWVNYPINTFGITFNYLNKNSKLMKKNDLPLYSNTFYPKQEEITLKGGLVPHFILGYYKTNTMEIEINPNLLEQNKSNKNIVFNGLDIDQSTFSIAINKTNYISYFLFDDQNDYINVQI